ncbi:hypothetical protein K4I79_002705 [Candida tropicalis]
MSSGAKEALDRKDDLDSEFSFVGEEKTICEQDPPITTTPGINPRIECWRLFIHNIFRTVVELNHDLDVWKWFMFSNYKGKQEVQAEVQPEKFMIYGGPQHTREIYRRLKACVGKQISKLQFIVISKFGGQQFVTIFWTWSSAHIRVYDVLTKELELFYKFAAAKFRSKCECTHRVHATMAYVSECVNDVIDQKRKAIKKTGRIAASANKPKAEYEIFFYWIDVEILHL